MDGIVSINGRVQPLAQAKISVLDRGFLFGDGIFEVLVGFNKKLIALEKHLTRLRYSGKSINLELPWSDEEMGKEVLDVYSRTEYPKSYVRIGVTRGEGLGIVPGNSSYNKLIYILPSQPSPAHFYNEGICVKTESKQSTVRGPSIKNPFYLPSIVKMIDIKDEYDDVLWVNPEQEITEAATSNVFFVGREGHASFVETPALDSGLLGGITRQIVIELLRENGVEVRERTILLEELAGFDEAFLTSTIRGLVPIRRIDDKKFESTRATALFHKISAIFQAWIDKQVGKHCDWNTGLS